jgi:hypothetical protein
MNAHRSTFRSWKPEIDEYFERFRAGIYDQGSFLQLIFPEDALAIKRNDKDLVIGTPGCDGMDFCFRQGERGVWAYYPYEDRYLLVAGNLQDLFEGWRAGSLSV